MLQLGKKQELTVIKCVNFGVYLAEGEMCIRDRYTCICCSNAFDKEDQGNQYIPYRILYAKLDWRYYSGIYLAAFIKWYFAVFSEDTDIFFCIWILGIGNFDAVAAGRLYDDYLYFRNPKYTRRIN